MGSCLSISPSRLDQISTSSFSSNEGCAGQGGCLLGGECGAGSIMDKFDIGEFLGRGAFATTQRCTEKGTGRQFAVKTIVKATLGPTERRRVRREVQVMRHLAGHPNIVRIEKAFEDENYVHLVMDQCTGGELVEQIAKKGCYPEREAAALIRSLLEAVAYAHDMGCMHRDIKLDNCLLLDASPGAPLKLIDWGFSTFMGPGEKRRALCGSVQYMAPEVAVGCFDPGACYGREADVWSCGVVLYAMLSGRLPFRGVTESEVAWVTACPRTGVPDMSGGPWPSISQPAKAAVAAMMSRDPRLRPSARDMLRCEWAPHRIQAGAAPASTRL